MVRLSTYYNEELSTKKLYEAIIVPNYSFVKELLNKNKANLSNMSDKGLAFNLLKRVSILNDIFKNRKTTFAITYEEKDTGGIVMASTTKEGYITLYVNSNIVNTIKDDFSGFVNNVQKITAHELVHIEQFNRSKANYIKSYIDKIDYYFDYMEIMAFSITAILEFRQFGIDENVIKSLLRNASLFAQGLPFENLKSFPTFHLYTIMYIENKDNVKVVKGYKTFLKNCLDYMQKIKGV